MDTQYPNLTVEYPKFKQSVPATFWMHGFAKKSKEFDYVKAVLKTKDNKEIPADLKTFSKQIWKPSGGSWWWWHIKFDKVPKDAYKLIVDGQTKGGADIKEYHAEVEAIDVTPEVNLRLHGTGVATVYSLPATSHPPQDHNIINELPYFQAWGTRDPGFFNTIVQATMQPEDAYEVYGEVFDDGDSNWAAIFDLTDWVPPMNFILLRVENVLSQAKNTKLVLL